jgi:hypothetical protein
MRERNENIKPLLTRRKFFRTTGLTATGIYFNFLRPFTATESKEPYPGYHDVKGSSTMRLAVFRADVTPPVGSPLCGGLVKPVSGVTEPLLALGIVILGPEKPVVLCAVDWCEIHNSDHVLWRKQLAEAAGTTSDRVAVHSLHQHNAPIADSVADRIMAATPSPVRVFDTEWGVEAVRNTAGEIKKALKQAKSFTHVTAGEAKVREVASNRRVMGPDGKVAFVRTSATKDPKVRAMPEGIIDPFLKTVSFWNGKRKLAALHYYATHPMSYYGDGMVTSDFVGIAREKRTEEDGIPHIYFTGCSGNITAGKYNDGDKSNRMILAGRIHSAMVESEKNAIRYPAGRIAWNSKQLFPGINPDFTEDQMHKVLTDLNASSSSRIEAALRTSFIRHCGSRTPVLLTSLRLGENIRLLHLPAESFVEYQLFAQQLFPGKFIATAAYTDTGAEYIPLERSYNEGGYEPTWAFAAPDTEKAMKGIISELLGA